MKTTHLLFALFLISSSAFATDNIPHCLNRGSELPINNASVVQLEHSTPNQYKTQAHVKGTVTQLYPDHNGHKHFAIQFEGQPSDGIEVVYNTVFGALPALRPGMTVEACGEYITSNAPTSQYSASPMDAIIHWVHINPNQGIDQHASGFLVIDGTLCGQDATNAGHNGHGPGHGGHGGHGHIPGQNLDN